MKTVDFLVAGSGIAGLSFALKAARLGTVAVLAKGRLEETNTRLAQGGIACVSAPADSFELHIQDTIEAGAGLCNPEAVELVVREAPNVIAELIELGVQFSRNEEGYSLHREGGHSCHRILHYQDLTGAQVQQGLLRAVRHHPNIRLYEGHHAVDLLLSKATQDTNARCHGIYVLEEESGNCYPFLAQQTVLCTGGSSQVFQHTTNPDLATGDGLAMAARAGLRLKHLEFAQFHPTALYAPGLSPAPLITEALRGAGAALINSRGESFMQQYHRDGALAPRDVVARAEWLEMHETDHPCVYLDATHLGKDKLRAHFPTITQACEELGINPAAEPIPVVPAAHYNCGGIPTDLSGRTALRGLFALGEVACTGLHGANRLASNSLLEALVFAQEAAAAVAKEPCTREQARGLSAPELPFSTITASQELLEEPESRLKQVMWECFGIYRTKRQMKWGLQQLEEVQQQAEGIFLQHCLSPHTLRLRNLSAVALQIGQQAFRRSQSVGLHAVAKEPAAEPIAAPR